MVNAVLLSLLMILVLLNKNAKGLWRRPGSGVGKITWG